MTVCLLHQLRKTQGIPDPSTMWNPHPSTSFLSDSMRFYPLPTFISRMISFLEETVKFVFFFFRQSMKLSSGKEYLPLSS